MPLAIETEQVLIMAGTLAGATLGVFLFAVGLAEIVTKIFDA